LIFASFYQEKEEKDSCMPQRFYEHYKLKISVFKLKRIFEMNDTSQQHHSLTGIILYLLRNFHF